MANKEETLVASSPIKCPPEKFYNFFKFNLTDIVKIYPAFFTEGQVLEGEQGSLGCVLFFRYTIGGVAMTMKISTEVVDDAAKTLKFTVLEGDFLLLYKSFSNSLIVSEGLAKWSMEYEKLTILSPPPEIYVPVLVTLCTLADAFLLLN